MPKRPPQHPQLRYKERRSPIGTWLLRDERDRLCALAAAHGVTLSLYLRAVVVDAVVEEMVPTTIGQDATGRLYDFVNRCRPISTWVLKDERARLQTLAAAQGVSLSAYLRALIADVLAEEVG